MDTNALKKFAQAARRDLLSQVEAKLTLVLADASIERREPALARTMVQLDRDVAQDGKQAVIDRVAYTWFNRFTALRYMDVIGLNEIRVVSPNQGDTRPEALAEALAGNVPAYAPDSVTTLLNNPGSTRDLEGQVYRQLLTAACHHWNRQMPFMFEGAEDYSELLMPDDLLSPSSILAQLRTVMTSDTCQDVEIIGWLYQFYISEKKDEVFAGLKKNVKITPDNIPAATQLFTPHWIVRYLVENSLGRLWLLNNPTSGLADHMPYYIAPEQAESDFLVVSKPEELKVCDPACGSGHMLTYAFDLLYRIYEERGYDPLDIPGLILAHNLYGIEIDQRAGTLAAFALAMKAAQRLGRRRFLRAEGLEPNICVLKNADFTDQEVRDVVQLTGQDLFTADLRETLGQFRQADNFGSLIVPALEDPAETRRAVQAQEIQNDLMMKGVQGRVLKVLQMAEYLAPRYHVVVANPPYMGGKGMNAALGDFAKAQYPDSRSDLFAMFMERNWALGLRGALTAMINMQSWMFLSSYEKLRLKMLENRTLVSMAHMGERAFDTIGGAVVSTTAFVSANRRYAEFKGDFVRLVDGEDEADKAAKLEEAIQNLGCGWFHRASAEDFGKIPGSPIAYWASNAAIKAFACGTAVGCVAEPRQGLATGENDRFLRQWHEVSFCDAALHCENIQESVESGAKWFPYNKGGSYRKWYGNFEYFVNWHQDGDEIRRFTDKEGKIRSRPQNTSYYFRKGLTWTATSSSYFGIRHTPAGHLFDVKGSSCFARDDLHYPLLGFLASKVASAFLRFLNPTIEFQNGDIKALPLSATFSQNDFQSEVDEIVSQLVGLSQSDWDSFEFSWNFKLDPLCGGRTQKSVALVEVYKKRKIVVENLYKQGLALETENNRIFIEAYGLQDELSPEVPLSEITLTCNPHYRYSSRNLTEAEMEAELKKDTMAEFLSYAVGCMFGRYSLDKPGLVLADQGQGVAEYLAKIGTDAPQFEIDADNIIPFIDGDWFDDDVTERFRQFLRVTFGDEHFAENLAFIEDALGLVDLGVKNKRKSIRQYFLKDFYKDHAKRYKNRPIYWMFSSPKGSFNALIYMHRYRPDTVSTLLNEYIRDFVNKLEAEKVRLVALEGDVNADKKARTAAIKTQADVNKQLAELKTWEREVMLPLAQQNIAIDLDDGVKANYPKFGTALKKIAGLSA